MNRDDLRRSPFGPPVPGGAPRTVVNAMTIDVEDYFQVSAFEDRVCRTEWHTFNSRVCRNTDRLLEIFDEARLLGTFFVLGWVAERFPDLVRRIAAAGHEVASHGYEHQLVYSLTPRQFRDDVRRAKAALECAAGTAVLGYRAPSFSITNRSLWALDVLIEEGYAYDASIYPIHHDRYGIPDWPRHPHRVERANGSLWEIPGSTTRWAGMNLPIGGGGYFRHFPYGWTRHGIRRLNETEGRPAIFYLHPWEIDPEQPRVASTGLTRMRHYWNLDKTETRLRRLLADFNFGRITEILQSLQTAPAWGPRDSVHRALRTSAQMSSKRVTFDS
jgi:polysaccharide deacetylase family protein (PEP-CTERM system associated)